MTERLKWPMELVNGSFATVEQDSDEDITQCIKAILSHRPGDRPDIPEMGIEDLAFSQQPLDADAVEEVIRRHEPRIDVMAEASTVSELVAGLVIQWAPNIETLGGADG